MQLRLTNLKLWQCNFYYLNYPNHQISRNKYTRRHSIEVLAWRRARRKKTSTKLRYGRHRQTSATCGAGGAGIAPSTMPVGHYRGPPHPRTRRVCPTCPEGSSSRARASSNTLLLVATSKLIEIKLIRSGDTKLVRRLHVSNPFPFPFRNFLRFSRINILRYTVKFIT